MSFVLIITGPAGSGKSTVSSRLASQFPKCVNIDIDQVKHFVVSDFKYDETPSGRKQWELLGNNIGLLTHNFHNSGYNVIVNGYLDELALGEIQKQIAFTHKILLLPDLDTTTKRDMRRSKETRMGKHAVRTHHNYFSNSSYYDDFVPLNTSKFSINETTEKILKIIQGK